MLSVVRNSTKWQWYRWSKIGARLVRFEHVVDNATFCSCVVFFFNKGPVVKCETWESIAVCLAAVFRLRLEDLFASVSVSGGVTEDCEF